MPPNTPRPALGSTTKWFNGDIYRLGLTDAETGGGLSLVDATVPPGGGPIPHVHRESDEHYIVIAGEVEFQIGEERLQMAAGDCLSIPRGTLHGFHNGGIQPAHMVFMFTPSGPERFFVEAGDDPVPGQQVQPWGPERVTPELLAQAERYDTFVPPPSQSS